MTLKEFRHINKQISVIDMKVQEALNIENIIFIKNNIISLAEKYDTCGEDEKSEIVDNLLQKLQKTKDEHKDVFDKIQKYLDYNREKNNEERKDTGLAWELMQQWYNPRTGNR